MSIIDRLLWQGTFGVGWAFVVYPLIEERPFQWFGAVLVGNMVFAALLAIALNTLREEDR